MHSFLAEELQRSVAMLAKGTCPAPRFRVFTPAREYMLHLHPESSAGSGSIPLLVCAVAYFMVRCAATSYVFTAVYRAPASSVGDALFGCQADRAQGDAVVRPIASFDPLGLGDPEHYRLPDCPLAFDASLLLLRPPPPPSGLRQSDWPLVLTTLIRRGLLTVADEKAWLTGAGRVLH